MTDRTVKVTLRAEAAGYIAGMDQAAAKTRATGTELEKLAQKRQAFTTLGVGALAFGTAVALGLGFAISKYAEFDAAMSNSNAVLQESRENQALLRDAALEAGGATVYTATESANAIEELGKAGIGTSDILGGALTGSLDLAASGELEVARAAEIAGVTLRQFKLDGDEAGRVADVLSAGANKAVGSVDDLAQGLKFVAPVAQGMNVSLEDTVATLALFADQGVIGEQAGTSLRGMLSSLTSPSKQARDELDRLGVSLYDKQGKFKGLENVASELHRTLGDVTDAERDATLGIIFGNQQVTAARILVDAGAESWREYRDAVDDSGIASRIAAARMDNLSGDVEKLGGAFDTALIQSGSGANDILRTMVQTATALVDWFGALPEPVIGVATAVGAAAAAVALLGGASFLAVPKIAAARETLANLGITARTAAIGVGAATAALSVALIVFGAIAADAADNSNAVDSFADSLDKATGNATDYTRELIGQRLASEGAVAAAERLGIGVGELIDLTLKGTDAASAWGDAQRTANAENPALIAQYDLISGGVEEVAGQLEAGTREWKLNRDATEAARDAAEQTGGALAEMRGEAYDAEGQIASLSEQIRNFASGTLDSREAQRQFRDAVDAANEALKENGATLDINTEAGRENEASLDAIARKALDAAAALYDETGSQDLATQAIQNGRQALIDQLAQYGITGPAAEDYANKLGLIPSNVTTSIALNGVDEATEKVQGLYWLLRNPPQPGDIGYGTVLAGTGNFRGNLYAGGVQAFASGGFPSGIYAGRQGGIHKFAESEMGVPWETYISGRAQDRARNIGLWQRTGDLLGAWRTAPAVSYSRAASSQTETRTVVKQPIENVLMLDKYVLYRGMQEVDIELEGSPS